MSDPTYDVAIDDRKNRIKVGHLVVGLVFLGLAASWALRASGVIGDPQTGVVIPVVLVLAGIAGLAVTFFGSLIRRPSTPRLDTTTPTYDTEENQS